MINFNTAKRFSMSVIFMGTVVLLGAVSQTHMVSYAVEPGTVSTTSTQGQSSRWEGQGDEWSVKDGNGGYLKNSWFQDDATGHWYMLGAGEDGTLMYSGLVTDHSTGKTYLMNTEHDGTYGRLISVDGAYNLNGRVVYLQFNQSHDGSFGAITSGLTEARQSGIKETAFSAIPTGNNGTTQSQQQPNGDGQTANSSASQSGTGEFAEGWRNKPVSQMTEAEKDQLFYEITGGGHHAKDVIIDTDGGKLDDSNFHG